MDRYLRLKGGEEKFNGTSNGKYMCLGVPGKIEKITVAGPFARSGIVRFGGIEKEVNLDLVDDAGEGDYVVVHAGFAISRVDEVEAKRIFEFLREMGELESDAGEVGK